MDWKLSPVLGLYVVIFMADFGLSEYNHNSGQIYHFDTGSGKEVTFRGQCDMMHPCSQVCVDLPYMSSFRCACSGGMVLAPNGFLCIIENEVENEKDGSIIDVDAPAEKVDEKPLHGAGILSRPSFDQEMHSSVVPTEEVSGDGSGYSPGSGYPDDTETDDDDEDYIIAGSGVGGDFDFEEEEEAKPTPGPHLVITPTQNIPHVSPTDATPPSKNVMRTMDSLDSPSTVVAHIGELEPTARLTTAELLTCEDMHCFNGGECVMFKKKPKCLCSLGFYGEYCEEEIEILYPSFSGDGYLQLPTPTGAYHAFNIRLDIKPHHPNGLLLFSSENHPENHKISDYFSVSIVNGHVQFRFNCGSGNALLEATHPITMDTWHTVIIQREQQFGILRVDDQEHVTGRSKGTYTKLSIDQPLYLGGHPAIEHLHIDVWEGFHGCVERLIIDAKDIDLRPGPIGLGAVGVNVGECSLPLCQENPCMNGGSCSILSPERHVCLCPLGRHGVHCQEEIVVSIPSFNGTSYIAHKGLANSHLSFLEIEIVFRPFQPDGVIIYSGLNTDGTGDFVSLSLKKGHLEFRFDCGSGPAIIRTTEPISMAEWHVASAARTAREGILKVNDLQAVKGYSMGAFTQTSFMTDFYIGGVHNYNELPKGAMIESSFVGDIQRVIISDQPLDLIGRALRGINVGNANHPCIGNPCLNDGECVPHHETFVCLCRLGYEGPNCEETLNLPIKVPSFLFKSYFRYTGTWVMERISGLHTHFSLHFRILNSNGLILWVGQNNHTRHRRDFMSLSVEEGKLRLRFNLGHGVTTLVSNTLLNDGEWHKAAVNRTRGVTMMKIDEHEIINGRSPGLMKSLDVNDGLYIGGAKDIERTTHKKFKQGIAGCIREFKLEDELTSLFEEPSDGQNVGECIGTPDLFTRG